MEQIEVKTPKGYIVYLKSELTYGQYIEVQKMIAAHIKVDSITKQIKDLEGASLFDANQKTLEYLLIKVIHPDGTESTNLLESINNMPLSDGRLVAQKVNEINQASQTPQKKGSY